MLVCPECGTILDNERMMYPIPICCQEFILREDDLFDKDFEDLYTTGQMPGYFYDEDEDDEY